jgi:hypothetical protein
VGPALIGLGVVEAVACGVVYVSWRGRLEAGTDAAPSSAPVAVTPAPASRPSAPAPTEEPRGAERVRDAESPACSALAAENEAKLAKLERADAGDGCPIERPDVNCVTTPNGVTWGYRLVKSRTVDDSPEHAQRDSFQCHSTNELDLVRIDASGERAIPGRRLSLDHQWYNNSDSHRVDSLADYDGDGEYEILLTHDARQHEGGPEHEALVLKYKAGVLGPYAPAAGIAIDHAEDVDGDGRADLVSPGRYSNVTSEDVFGNGWPVGPAIFVWHSEPDGTFREGGPASIAFAKKRCPSRPAVVLADEHFGRGDSDALAIVCARLWGAPAEEIERAWDRVCANHEAGGDPLACQGWPKDLAAIEPPFDLRAGEGGP